MVAAEVALGPQEKSILEFDVPAGKQGDLPGGRVWCFGCKETEGICVRLSQTAPALPNLEQPVPLNIKLGQKAANVREMDLKSWDSHLVFACSSSRRCGSDLV